MFPAGILADRLAKFLEAVSGDDCDLLHFCCLGWWLTATPACKIPPVLTAKIDTK